MELELEAETEEDVGTGLRLTAVGILRASFSRRRKGSYSTSSIVLLRQRRSLNGSLRGGSDEALEPERAVMVEAEAGGEPERRERVSSSSSERSARGFGIPFLQRRFSKGFLSAVMFRSVWAALSGVPFSGVRGKVGEEAIAEGREGRSGEDSEKVGVTGDGMRSERADGSSEDSIDMGTSTVRRSSGKDDERGKEKGCDSGDESGKASASESGYQPRLD